MSLLDPFFVVLLHFLYSSFYFTWWFLSLSLMVHELFTFTCLLDFFFLLLIRGSQHKQAFWNMDTNISILLSILIKKKKSVVNLFTFSVSLWLCSYLKCHQKKPEQSRIAYLNMFWLVVYKLHQNVTSDDKQNFWHTSTSFSRKLVVFSLKSLSPFFMSIKIC